ncbi:MAG: ABC transporter permease [Candidatus Acidiferrales bacterium]
METLLQDVKYGARMLAKSPGFALVAILTLALGIGANTTIFSVVNAALLRPLPYPQPDELVMVWANVERRGGPAQEWTNPADLYDWRAQNQVFVEMAALGGNEATLAAVGEAEQLSAAVITHQMFSVLRTPPVLGRDFTHDEDKPNGPNVVILSHGLWQRRFGSDSTIIGRAITWNGQPFTVVGIMPAGFRFPVVPTAELWTLLQQAPTDGRGNAYLRVIARMKPGVTLQNARAEMDVISQRLEQQYPENEKKGTTVTRLSEFFAGPARPALLLLLAAVGVVLLIACANIASLLMARATARQREIAIRVALGASRGRLVRQLLTESVLVSLAGGALGLLLATWGVGFLVTGLPQDGRAFFDVSIDRAVLAFTFAIAVLTPLLFGIVPALQASRPRLHDSLKEGGRTTGARGARLRSLLVSAEIALSLMLLVGAGLLLRSFGELLRVDTGFRTENVLQARLLLPQARYEGRPEVHAAYHRMLERVRGLGGVTSAAAISTPPLGGFDNDTGFRVEGRPEPKIGERVVAWFRAATPDYFRTMGIPLRRGRLFTEADSASAPLVLLANESFVKKHFAGEDPLGKRIGSPERWRQIIGVVGNVRNFGLDREEPPAVYLPHAQLSTRFMTLVLRTERDPLAVTANLRGVVREIDPDVALANVSTMEQAVQASMAGRRWTMTLLGAFASLAMLLAAIGLYGVMAYSVGQRTQEIGIRVALGAQRADVLRMVLGDGMKLWIAGMVVGVAGAFVATRWLASLLFGIAATDPLTFVLAPALLAAVAVLATVIPARRAMRVDPMVALRYE